jgi:hypothetical protein
MDKTLRQAILDYFNDHLSEGTFKVINAPGLAEAIYGDAYVNEPDDDAAVKMEHGIQTELDDLAAEGALVKSQVLGMDAYHLPPKGEE